MRRVGGLAKVAFCVFCVILGCNGLDDTIDRAKAALSDVLGAQTASEILGDPDCSGTESLPTSLDSIWDATQQCTHLAAAPPRVLFSTSTVCPRSGQPDCLADVPFFPCSDDPSQTCGAIGRFRYQCGAIELPSGSTEGAAHEMIHYLKYENHQPDWQVHTGPEWACQ